MLPNQQSFSSSSNLHNSPPNVSTNFGHSANYPIFKEFQQSLQNQGNSQSIGLLCDFFSTKLNHLIQKVDPKNVFYPSAEKPQYVCPECGKVFAKSSGVGGHISKMHKDRKKLVQQKNGDEVKEKSQKGSARKQNKQEKEGNSLWDVHNHMMSGMRGEDWIWK